MNKDLEKFWSEFYKYAEEASLKGMPTLFRGVYDHSYKLIPSIGRDTTEGTYGNIETLEYDLITDFKRLSIPELKETPTSDFEWLFLAQHYGLPTRLLDWSSNPMVGLFFAVSGGDNTDGALYIAKHQVSDQYELFDYKTANVSESEKSQNPISRVFSLQQDQGKVIFVRPKYSDQRYINQKSVFSCPANPFEEIEIDRNKITIKKECKDVIRKTLRTMGISHSYIYPGLEGITKELKIHEFDPIVKGKRTIFSAKTVIPAFK